MSSIPHDMIPTTLARPELPRERPSGAQVHARRRELFHIAGKRKRVRFPVYQGGTAGSFR
jgi:hypothetical protein